MDSLEPKLLAQITNPWLPPELGSEAGGSGASIVSTIVVTLWRSILLLGGLAVLVMFAWGGLSYVLSNGDKAAIEAARNRIVYAIVGIAILATTFALAEVLGPALGIDILSIPLPVVNGS